ncbi:MAG: glycoside hydrolase family 3 C-terminal domain-containing protein, partial [Stenotrophomonas maltophilia]|nr:glycoside hydrolase family 3 C-terminal domain-containing protein [Stenotrophomonas maltophilia]
TRLFTARMRLGMFDPTERVRWARIPASVNQAPAHDALALKAAQASLVLLKNDGILPLSRDIKRIAVVGPTADDTMALLGNYFGTPAAPVTILQGVREAAKGVEVRYARGVDLVEGRDDPGATPLIEPTYLRPSAESPERGLRGEYFRTPDLSGTPALVRTDAQIGFRWDRGSPTDNLLARGEAAPGQGIPNDRFSIRWSGQLLPPVSGRYRLEVAGDDGYRLYLDGKRVIDHWVNTDRLHAEGVELDLQAGRAYDLKLEYYDDQRDAGVRLGWRMPGAKAPFDEALDAARDADVVVFVGGLTGDVEGEEMTVNYPGFAGGDRTDLRLPAPQRTLLEALHGTGKPVVMVLTGGSAIAVDWAQAHLPAILMSWYPGQRGGTAVGQALFGDVNPAGRLPVTFYKAGEAMPAFDDYAMEGRTYRYFRGTPLYPFGHGLSYTRFDYGTLRLDADSLRADGRLGVAVDVTNAGTRSGDEVVQLYVRREHAGSGDAVQELRGFQRVQLAPGERRTVTFILEAAQALRHYDEARAAYAVQPGAYEVRVGASSADIRAQGRFTVVPALD